MHITSVRPIIPFHQHSWGITFAFLYFAENKERWKKKAYRIEVMERREVELGTTYKNKEKMKVKNMLSKRIKARLSKINDGVIDFVEKEKFKELAVIGKSRLKE